MEYMHPLWVGKPPFAGTGKVCKVVYGRHLTFVVTTHPRTSRNIVALCTRNIFKLMWFLAAYRFYIANVEYLPAHVECQQPNYG